MNTGSSPMVSYHSILVLAIIAGIIGLTTLLILQDGELLALMLTLAVLGGLTGGTNSYKESDRHRLVRGYKSAFEWLLLVLLIAYALIESSRWFDVTAGIAAFMNEHWPGMIVSLMCILIGIAGFQRTTHGDSA